MSKHPTTPSLSEINNSVDTTIQRKGWRKVFAFFGPAYLVSVGYMDPGNWATDLQGGAKFGYSLLWVLLMSNIMALLLQSLSARLGIVRRRDLAQANREVYPKGINFCLYILAELAIAATDLAEVLGMAVGLKLLTGLDLIWGVLITTLDTFLFLWLQRLGMRKIEAFILLLVATIGVSFLVEIIFAKPDLGEVAKGFIPSGLTNESLYIAMGIIGATVMPHNLYLHSALVQSRKIGSDDKSIKSAIKYNTADSAIALNAALFVNAAILILAATVFNKTGNTHIAEIEEAHAFLAPLLGTTLAPILFAVALIAAGQSSTITGTLAGQIVMEGYLHLRINPVLRRLLTRLIAIIPAVIVILIFGDDKVDELLVFSQVILSLQLGFAVIPLIHFVSDKKTMGKFAIKVWVKIFAWIIAIVLVSLNIKLLYEQIISLFENTESIWLEMLVVAGALGFITLLVFTVLYPVIRKKIPVINNSLHNTPLVLNDLKVKPVNTIAVALEFSTSDEKLIAHALNQGKKDVTYLLLHIVESVTATVTGKASDDLETRNDMKQLENYAEQLQKLGYKVKVKLGYKTRVKEIVRIVKEENADMVVMGAHRHKGLKDYVFGETIEAVRHEVEVPVLIVNV